MNLLCKLLGHRQGRLVAKDLYLDLFIFECKRCGEHYEYDDE